MSEPQHIEEKAVATLTDEEIETQRVAVGSARPAASTDDGDDSSDTGDDTGDTSDASDTGDDSGDSSDTGDDSGSDS